jgi:lysophospholipase L1-like esterase
VPPLRIAFVGDSLTAGLPGASFLAVLRAKLPGHTLINLGRGNDTVVSLYRRLARHGGSDRFDMAFLWIGVNDVTANESWSFRLMNALRSQPRSNSLREFRANYQAILELLRSRAERVVAVSPLLKGEDLDSEWNRRLAELTHEIESLAAQSRSTAFLDLRPRVLAALSNRRTASYLPNNVFRVALDILTLRGTPQIDRVSAQRGLYLTLDGVHLNSQGARLVADAFLEVITQQA